MPDGLPRAVAEATADSVKVMNEFLELRASQIHGRGVFSRQDVVAGTRLIEYVGERITKEESTRRGLAQYDKAQKEGCAAVYIFDLDEGHDLDGDIPDNDAKYINHSCAPNAEAINEDGRIWIFALRDLRLGDELTFDYGYDVSHWKEHPCRCGAPDCVGYIVSRRQWPKLRRLIKRAAHEAAKAAKARQPIPKKPKSAKKAGRKNASKSPKTR